MTIDERIAAELRRHAPQVTEHRAWERIQSEAPVQRRARAIRLVSIPVAALGLLLLGFVLVPDLFSGPEPASDPGSPFLGTWMTTDLDGSTPTMVIQVSADEGLEILVHDDFASVCSGAPSTMTGTGRFEGSTELVIPSPVLTCDDGTQPEALSGLPLEEQLQNLTFGHDPQADTLTDKFGLVWNRVGAVGPSPGASSGMWPQSSLEEVREAQRLADAGDPEYTWQVDPELAAWTKEARDTDAFLNHEILTRFIQEELGWEGFSWIGFAWSDGWPEAIGVRYVRCAPGESNSLYPDDDQGSGCSPTIDEFNYETVEISVAQPVRQDPSGIWVVTSWVIVEPTEQVVPLPNAEATAILEAFLQARIDGEGAEQYFSEAALWAPLLYATTTGATYERSEFEIVDGPAWPSGSMRFEVRMFAEDGHTVVEQSFILGRDWGGGWRLDAGPETRENGEALAEFYDILGGEVTFQAAYPWEGSPFAPRFETNGKSAIAELDHPDGAAVTSYDYMRILADPLTLSGCQEGPPPANAEALAQSILADDRFETTVPVATTVGGAPGLVMDVVATAATTEDIHCDGLRTAVMRSFPEPGSRMRLYLVDLPGGSARVLSIAIVASEERFESVVEAAAAILDSFEFHTG